MRGRRALLLLLALLARGRDAVAEEGSLRISAPAAERGVVVEIATELTASADAVASVVGDPSRFPELFPAEKAIVLDRGAAGIRVAVTMREPWPAGVVYWIERVQRRDEAATRVVHREAELGGYYRSMVATWRVTPRPTGGCAVVYRVAMDLVRWAPKWMLRRGVTRGMSGSLGRLRTMLGVRAAGRSAGAG